MYVHVYYQKGVVVLGCGQFCLSLLRVLSVYFLAVLEISVCAY